MPFASRSPLRSRTRERSRSRRRSRSRGRHRRDCSRSGGRSRRDRSRSGERSRRSCRGQSSSRGHRDYIYSYPVNTSEYGQQELEESSDSSEDETKPEDTEKGHSRDKKIKKVDTSNPFSTFDRHSRKSPDFAEPEE